MNEIYIVMDTNYETGAESVVGVFETKQQALIFTGEHALQNDIETSNLYLFKKKVEVNK